MDFFWTIALGMILCAWAFHMGKQQGARETKITYEGKLRRKGYEIDGLQLQIQILESGLRPKRPKPKQSTWRDVFGYHNKIGVTREDISNTYRRLAKERQASEAALKELNVARDEAFEEIK